MILLLAATAFADPVASETAFTPKPLAGRPVFDMRLGVVRSDPTSHPYICAEGQPLAWLSLEACGTGSGFLHQGTDADMAHFRTRARVAGVDRGRWEADLLAGAGFAEIQIGEDAHGFRFGEAEESDQNEGAGPEASLAGKGRMWFDPRAYVTMDASFGVAFVPSAPTVIGQGGPWVPFAAVTAGVGF